MLKFNNSQSIDAHIGKKYVHLKKGFGKFKIIDGAEKISNKANPMAYFLIEVTDDEGTVAQIHEYIVFGNQYTEANVARFLAAVGRKEDWKNMAFSPGLYVGLTGRCEINHEDEFNEEKGRVFTKNKIWMMPKGEEWDKPRMSHVRLHERFYINPPKDGARTSEEDSWLHAHHRTAENQARLNDESTYAAQSFDDDIPL